MPRSMFLAAVCFSATCLADVVRLEPERVFDGERMQAEWVVIVDDDRIAFAGERRQAPDLEPDRTVTMPGKTLLPGLIEGHSHVLLHPYDETPWNDQVLKESEAERVARAVNHVRASLFAGVTTMRDLGSEGAGFADVGIRDAINKGVIVGPRLLVAGRALVATGSYGPRGFHERVPIPLGAEAADGHDALIRAVRGQIGRGVDLVKVYADYRWGPNGAAEPTYTEEELATIVRVTRSSGRSVVAHASTPEAMRRAVLAGVATIEHGDRGTEEVFRLMAEREVALCPTLAAGDAISQYGGWRKGLDPEPARVQAKRSSFKAALDAGVTICFGGDVGVYPHGDNVRELELMVDYGMSPMDALRAATSVNADVFGLGNVGRIAAGLQADVIAVDGDPSVDVSQLRQVEYVMRDGVVYLDRTGDAIADARFRQFIDWFTGRWDNVAQVAAEAERGVAATQRHERYAMNYVPIETANIDGVVFAIHNYGREGFAGELSRISLHRFSYRRDTDEVFHQFLFLRDPDKFALAPARLDELTALRWSDVRTNAGCSIHWQWQHDHFAGATKPGACVTSSYTPEPIVVEGYGELWANKLVRHDRNFRLDGSEIARNGGQSPEIFCKLEEAGGECL